MKKENVIKNFIEMIKVSWTYEKLTSSEKDNFEEVIYSERTKRALKGTYIQRWEILQAIYMSFLMALNYEPLGWRVNEEVPLF